MATLGVTDKQLQNLTPSNGVTNKHFGEGFEVRVYPDGRKIVRYSYQLHGKRRVLKLGEYGKGEGKMSCAQLIKAHRVASGLKASGEDPAGERDAKKVAVLAERMKTAEIENRLNVKKLSESFQKRFKGLRGKAPSKRTMSDYIISLDKVIVPKFGDVWVDDIDGAVLINWMAEMAEDTPAKANRQHSTLSTLFTWANRQKLMKHHPLLGTQKPAGNVEKDRALDFNSELQIVDKKGPELKQFWNNIDKAVKNPLHAEALKLILLTGKRPSEVLQAKWEHIIDIDGEETWIIPVSHSKNRKGAPRVPVTPMIQELFDRLPKHSDFLFPDRSGKKPIVVTTIGSALREGQQDKESGLYGMTPFTSHDLRRTCATHLGDIGFSLDEIKSILDHSISGDVTGIYVRSDNVDKRRVMLEAWHTRLNKILSDKEESNVVEMRK